MEPLPTDSATRPLYIGTALTFHERSETAEAEKSMVDYPSTSAFICCGESNAAREMSFVPPTVIDVAFVQHHPTAEFMSDVLKKREDWERVTFMCGECKTIGRLSDAAVGFKRAFSLSLLIKQRDVSVESEYMKLLFGWLRNRNLTGLRVIAERIALPLPASVIESLRNSSLLSLVSSSRFHESRD